MCVMFAATTGQLIPSYALMKAGWDHNPHGAGFMYPDAQTQTLRIVKGLMTWTAFKDAFAKHRKRFSDDDGFATVDVAVHFRIRSHGPVNAAMTHPHVIVPDRLAVMHNGIIHGLRADHAVSDTVVFVQECLSQLPKGWHRNRPIQDLIAGRIGAGNKFIVFDQKGLATISNRTSGVVHDGVWWSNGHHLPRARQDTIAFDFDAPCVEPVELKPSCGGKVIVNVPQMTIQSAELLDNGELRVTTKVDDEVLEVDLTLAQAEALLAQLRAGHVVSDCAMKGAKPYSMVVAEARKHVRKGGGHACN